jgi:cytochrome c biogenesis protein CcdA/thiol-disulfide isomerase/thioredoxin
MLLLIGAFLAGVITVLAPCVLPLLPIIIGGSISGDIQDKRRPFIIAASLAASLIIFTVLLKATTLLIDIPPSFFVYFSGAILVALGVVFLFPHIYEKFILALNLQAKSQQLLGKSGGRGAIAGAIITGAALGPVFSSCSPVYAYIIATVLPVNFPVAMSYMIAYVLGLSLMLLLIGFLGQKFVRKIKFASDPRGWFNKAIAIIFIIVGALIITGYDKKLQTYVSESTPFNFDGLSAKLIPSDNKAKRAGVLNVAPYKAPEFKGLEHWINASPQTLDSLKGKVVLIDFWTYSCINCIRTQPYLKEWYRTYKSSDFVIIGVHAPEFAFERTPKNVEAATKKAGLEYPVALDNDFATWGAYKNSYWPASYLIDKDGMVRREHFGEGEYSETEDAIRQLLAEKGGKLPAGKSNVADKDTSDKNIETPETYLGTKRASNYVGSPRLVQGEAAFTPSALGRVNNWTLGGKWNIGNEGVTAAGDNSILRFRMAAKEAYFVTASDMRGDIAVSLNGTPISATGSAGADVNGSVISVTSPRLYKMATFDRFQNDVMIELRVPAGVQLNSFTFGD